MARWQVFTACLLANASLKSLGDSYRVVVNFLPVLHLLMLEMLSCSDVNFMDRNNDMVQVSKELFPVWNFCMNDIEWMHEESLRQIDPNISLVSDLRQVHKVWSFIRAIYILTSQIHFIMHVLFSILGSIDCTRINAFTTTCRKKNHIVTIWQFQLHSSPSGSPT